jgi:hypothetical protein
MVWADELFVFAGFGLVFGAAANLLLGQSFYRPGGLASGLLSAGLMWIM